MKKRQAIPAAFVRGRRRFDAFRARRKGRAAFPADLWSLAVDLAREHGVNRTASALGLDYYSMKEHLEAADRCNAKSDFIEIVSGAPASATSCTIELEDPDGARMHVHVPSSTLPDLAAITRAFRGGRS